ncbi:MAG: hypothetical protein E2O39_09855 [Planctomycetota bacterium]|nr:MAG: hypothetical protein E2O39_09855 [Planctomycetota bacterium]
MKKRSRRGAARISAIWLIVFLVVALVGAAFGWIAQQDAAQARSSHQTAVSALNVSEARFEGERQISRDISQIFGYFNPSEAGSRTVVDAAENGLESLKVAFVDMNSTTATFEDAVPVVIAQYAARGKAISDLTSQVTDLRSQITAARDNLTSVSGDKDDKIRELQQQLSDAENQARDTEADLQGRLAAAQADRNDKDSQLRSARGDIDDLERQSERDKTAATTRMAHMADSLKFTKEPEAADGEILAISKALGIGWINVGARNRVNRGMIFHVISGKPGSDFLKGWCRVISVEETRSEVTFFSIVDQFRPIVPGDIIYNPVFDPTGVRNAVLVGRFSGVYSERELKLLLESIGITVQKRLDQETDYLIVGAEMYVDIHNDPVEEPIQPSELPVYKEAQAQGTQILSIRDVRQYFKK